MSKKTFYDFKGEPIGVKEFIELYEPCYFIENKKAEGIRHTQTARCVEDEVVTILNGHIESRADVAKVMAWKIGKIKHGESEENKKIVYAADWELCEEENPNSGKKMDLKTLADYILGNRDKLEVLAAEKPQECLNQLRDVAEKIDALGVDYKEDRRLDRALRVYGHAFEVKEGKCC